MKKLIALLLALSLMLSMAACGRPPCSVEGCTNKSQKNEDPEVILCLEHTCTIAGCKIAAAKETGLCPEHTCTTDGCTQVIVEGTTLCATHHAEGICLALYLSLKQSYDICQQYNLDMRAAYDNATAKAGRSSQASSTTVVDFMAGKLNIDRDIASDAVAGAVGHKDYNSAQTERALEDAFYDLMREASQGDSYYPISDLQSLLSHYRSCSTYKREKSENLETLEKRDSISFKSKELPRVTCDAVNYVYVTGDRTLYNAATLLSQASALLAELEKHYPDHPNGQDLAKTFTWLDQLLCMETALFAYLAQDGEHAVEHVPYACGKFDDQGGAISRKLTLLEETFS